jgi:hypothetical protein
MRFAVAVILLLGQFQWLPGAFVCTRQETAMDGCQQAMTGGPAVATQATQSHGATGCMSLGPCAVVSPAVLPSAQVAFVGAVVRAGGSGALARFSGFVASPLSPPPQA